MTGQVTKMRAGAIKTACLVLSLLLTPSLVEAKGRDIVLTDNGLPEFIGSGGFMAYSVDRVTLFRRTAEYVDKILRGAKPAELPFEQPTHFRLAVNLKAARELGLTVPESILVRADEVIQ